MARQRPTGGLLKAKDEIGPAMPGWVARTAYLAANRGDFSVANRYVEPTFLKKLSGVAGALESTRATLDRATTLPDETRGSIAATLGGCRRFADPNFCWKAMTRNGSLASVVVAREIIRGDRATVHLTLRLKNGALRHEKERLVRTPSGWMFGESRAPRARVSRRRRQSKSR
jgi:hypothetical protein